MHNIYNNIQYNIINNIINNIKHNIMYKVKNITLREKAAIIFSIITGITDNITFYSIAKGSENNINRESYSKQGKLLKDKQHIQQYYNDAQNIIDQYIVNRVKQLNINTVDINNTDSSNNNNVLDSFSIKNINFTNPTEFIQYLNDQANSIQDEKTKREYLKMLADLLRFKETGGDASGDIQRFYTPQTCQNCLLYNLKADEITQK